LVEIVHDIRKDLHGVRGKLPKRELPHAPLEAAPVKAKKPVAEHKLDKIEQALAEIEARMRTL
jgi:hypothetical protein